MLKDFLLSEKPSVLIRQNKEKIFQFIPELILCDGFNQYNDYHQYDVLEHILHVLDEVENNYVLRIAALFHDIGKPNSFFLDDNGIGHFYGHWNESIKIFNKYANKLELKEDKIELINNLIFYHDLNITDDNIELFNEVFRDDINLLISLKKADILAQNPKYSYRLTELNDRSKSLTKIKKAQ